MRTYLVVFLLLLLLLALTLLGHALHWGNTAAMAIAACKAALVAIYFMHLRIASSAVRAAACAGAIWLAILISLTLNDYVTR